VLDGPAPTVQGFLSTSRHALQQLSTRLVDAQEADVLTHVFEAYSKGLCPPRGPDANQVFAPLEQTTELFSEKYQPLVWSYGALPSYVVEVEQSCYDPARPVADWPQL